jgi:hypothetical protein
MVLWVFWITAIAIPICAILAVAHAAVWRKLGRRYASAFAWVFGCMTVLAILLNPLLNHVLLFPLCGHGVDRMLSDLKKERFVGKTKDELIARFGRPERTTAIHDSQEELVFDCHPWFYWSYSEGVCVNVTDGKVINFAYYH